MKKVNNKSSLGALQLVFIITGSILAAAGIIFLIVKLLKKSKSSKHCADNDCCSFEDFDADWDFDEDILEDLDLDDDECGCDCDCCDCGESEETAQADVIE